MQEVETLQRNLERQQKLLAKQKKTTMKYSNNDEIHTPHMQDTTTLERSFERQQKTSGKIPTKSSTYNSSHNEETLKISQKSSTSLTSVCQILLLTTNNMFITVNVFTVYF